MKLLSLTLFIFLCSKSTCEKEDNNPLFLTPLIENQQINLAKGKARVQHAEFQNITSYSGYLTVNKLYNSNIFFWFFPSVEISKNTPVLLWLKGGPGTTSLFGLFNENGPFYIAENSILKKRNIYWNINHNIIYIDNPVGVGYSFTDNDLGYVRNQTHVGRDLLEAMVQFFQLFPELKDNPFYVTGESYAGKYVIALSNAIKQNNEQMNDELNLKGFAISNGFVDPLNQMNRRDFLFACNLIDFNGLQELSSLEENVRTLIQEKNYTDATLLFDRLFAKFYTPGAPLYKNLTGYDSFYNILTNKPASNYSLFADFVQRTDIRKALHVGDRVFVKSSPKVRSFLLQEYTQSMGTVMAELLEGYKALIYGGNMDMIFPHSTTENYLRQLSWSRTEEYKKINRKKWYINGELAGYFKNIGNLNEVVVRNAGHLTSADQPLQVWKLITAFTRNQPLITS